MHPEHIGPQLLVAERVETKDLLAVAYIQRLLIICANPEMTDVTAMR